MSNNSRQDKIFNLLETEERMSVSDLAAFFHVTETTIRRDLNMMEANKQIVRRRGYAELPDRGYGMTLRRRNTFQDEKRRIAKKAAGMLRYGSTLALDSGTTIAELVHVMAEQCTDLSLDIVTCSLKTAYETCRYFRTSIPGGSIFADELSISGMSAIRFFENITVDIAFLGSTGISGTQGLTVSYPLILDVKQAIMSCAAKKVALLDSSKFFARGVYTFCPFSELDAIITVRTEQNAEILDQIARQGVEVILA